MLTDLLIYLHMALIPIFLFAVVVMVFLTIFWRVECGLVLLFSLIPQPNIWFKLHSYPYGSYFINFIYLAVCIGLFLQRRNLIWNFNGKLIIAFILLSCLSFWNSIVRFSIPDPISVDNPLFKYLKNYVLMIAMYFVFFNGVKGEKEEKLLVTVMSLVILFVSIRSFRAYSVGESFLDAKRVTGALWIVGLGPNHFGAFISHYSAIIIGLVLFDKEIKRKVLYLITLLFCLHSVFFSFSRGAYLGSLATLIFLGVIKKRILLVIALVVVISWQTLLPASVVDRIKMRESETGELEHSAAARLDLWNSSINLFKENPILGSGFDGFKLTFAGEPLTDTHNFFLKSLCDQGIIGLFLLLIILGGAFSSGLRLFRNGKTDFYKGLGFGFLGCVVSLVVTNMFGDRWSYIEIGTYFWGLWGLVDRGILISQNTVNGTEKGGS